ncbi:hypothetical protein HanXRQr2_Chr06g0268881 [Helianthus annuus]|uniref:Uncharacterized protein n=1 Tax=Helianthus annuus TaxID=4232 RepID=A0A9K3IW52_HELAN|nr:hypothetical protein HanXRQr2_Chr06g0268881 [Helianthus annuus]KAJ0916249.1 hypothetical protein HanPSC8_Chr06g0259491 [Helianthus annuus]
MCVTKHTCFVEVTYGETLLFRRSGGWRNTLFRWVVLILNSLQVHVHATKHFTYITHIIYQTNISTYNSVCTITRQTSKQLNS